jgi:hypothetical protein
VLAGERAPQVRAHALALCPAFHGELAEVRPLGRRRQHRGALVRLDEVQAEDRAIEVVDHERSVEARLDEEAQPGHVDAREIVVTADLDAAADQSAGAARREQLAQERRRVRDRHRERVLHALLEQAPHLPQQGRLPSGQLRHRGVVVDGQADVRKIAEAAA